MDKKGRDEKSRDEKGTDEKGTDEKGMDKKGKDWNDFSVCERNCLMWPDFLVWEKAHDIEVHRKDTSDSLIGLVSVAVQDEENKSWYNVTKEIKQDGPAYGHVNPCEWIFKVDGTETTDCPNKKFSSLIRNGKKVVRLSIKKPVDPLTEFVKKWDAQEKAVILNLSQETDFQKRCRFVHFYSKDDSGHSEDRILVWEAKRGTGTSELVLHRGEELLKVNGEPVAGKKLAQIYKLILDQAPAAVELKMKAVQPNMSGVEETSKHSVLQENYSKSPDSSLAEDKAVFDDTYCLVEEKEMDTKAGRKASEILVNNAAFKNSSEIIAQPQTEPDSSEIQKSPPGNKKKSKRLSLRRSSSSNKTHCEDDARGSISPTSAENVAYTPTPPPQRKSPMCGGCVKKEVSQLPDNRNNWPIYKMEIGCLEEIHKLLDLDGRNAESLMVALDGFSWNEADFIKKECMPNGCGIAKKALDIWGTSNSKNNVGALKKILEKTMKRVDVVNLIEDWKKLRVCHGCGVKLN